MRLEEDELELAIGELQFAISSAGMYLYKHSAYGERKE